MPLPLSRRVDAAAGGDVLLVLVGQRLAEVEQCDDPWIGDPFEGARQ